MRQKSLFYNFIVDIFYFFCTKTVFMLKNLFFLHPFCTNACIPPENRLSDYKICNGRRRCCSGLGRAQRSGIFLGRHSWPLGLATTTTAVCGKRLPPAGGRCRVATKRGAQGGVVGAAASKTRVPLKARSGCWEPQPVALSKAALWLCLQFQISGRAPGRDHAAQGGKSGV